MDKNLAGLIGVAGLLAIPAAQAATAPPPVNGDAMQAASYADLLKPIPNAVALLKVADSAPAKVVPGDPAPSGEAAVEPAQFWFYVGPRRHHHHHHHHHWYHHHHHHHHT